MANVTIHDLTAALDADVLVGSVLEVELASGAGNSRKIVPGELHLAMLRLVGLPDTTGVVAIDLDNRNLVADDGTTVVLDWEDATKLISEVAVKLPTILDAANAVSINPATRILYEDDGTTAKLDWSVDGIIEVPTGVNLAAADGDFDVNGTTGKVLANEIEVAGGIGVHGAAVASQAASPATVTALTDSTGGTPGATLVDVGVVPDQGDINDNFASLNAKIDALRTQVDAIVAILEDYGFST